MTQPATTIATLDLPCIEEEIKARAALITENIVYIGQRLIQVKDALDHGQFAAWLAERVSFSQSTANNFMRIAREAPQSPGLLGLPYTKALALLDVPAGEREAFAGRHNVNDLSVREIQRLTKELEAAEEQARRARAAEGQARGLADEYCGKYHEQVEAAALAEGRLQRALENPVTVEVEVTPADYDQLRAAAERSGRLIREAEDYAEEQERQRNQAQAELRRLRESRDAEPAGGSHLDAEAFGKAVRVLMAEFGALPHMASFFQQMPREDVDAYNRWLDTLGEWLHGARQAIREGADRFVAAESTVV